MGGAFSFLIISRNVDLKNGLSPLHTIERLCVSAVIEKLMLNFKTKVRNDNNRIFKE